MGWIIVIIVGGIIGWLASLIMATDEEQGLLWNIVIGIVGSLLGKWIFSDMLGIGGAAVAGAFSIWGIIWGIVGAVILIAILKVLHILK
jgi:uncharacterized membrane protein YeaQ/YmgE (transglycosylase-associated protein family)